MFTHWRSGGLEDTALSDSDHEDREGDDGNGELTDGYTTHKDYEAYVPQSTHHSVPGIEELWARRIGRIEQHYSSLSIDTLFQHHPKLEEYLKECYDEDLVNKVDLFCTPPWSLPTC